MDIHKPKPWHGWRELLKEIGTIVIGVLVAIAFEQAVEWLHWRHKLADADAAVRFELHDDDLPQAYARIVVRGCLEMRLDALTAGLAADQPREAFSRLVQGYNPPFRTWDMNAWQAMVSSDVLTRLTAEEALHRSQAYNLVPPLGAINVRERQDATDLEALDPKPGALTPAERDRTVLALRRLRIDDLEMFYGSATLLHASEDLGVTLTDKDKARVISELRPTWGGCLVDPQMRHPGLNNQAPLH
ncbi:hypothetical protein [Phenylobacterium sp.]|jgi:hypothetical protein|uniref:hypothetical protein n=1 Tax=Phenylobacterium sp. TaxID=1871053 RepID=UPI0011FE3298|nr:hypothetical protein [Phenylobacterium sp.]THD65261.1 MAG: hypothetical protein E8A12_07325 [Phenylobacterium sp.]